MDGWMFKTINNHVCQSNTDKQIMPDQDRVINLCCYIDPSTMSNQQESQADIPDGYVSIRSDNGQQYLVPHFIILATHQAMEAYQKKVEFNVHTAHGGVRFPSFQCHCHALG